MVISAHGEFGPIDSAQLFGEFDLLYNGVNGLVNSAHVISAERLQHNIWLIRPSSFQVLLLYLFLSSGWTSRICNKRVLY